MWPGAGVPWVVSGRVPVSLPTKRDVITLVTCDSSGLCGLGLRHDDLRPQTCGGTKFTIVFVVPRF